jgi:ribosomal protein S18 acetylase RimI-like enzyme
VSGPAAAQRVRRARLRDRHAIRHLVDVAYSRQQQALGLAQDARQISFWWHILNRRLWLLENGKELVGLIGLLDGSIQLFIFFVTILPSAQRRGFGRMLVEFAENKARRRGLTRLQLDTPEGFVNAIEFYRHLGFVDIGRQNRGCYVSVVMMKRLDAKVLPHAAASAPRR